jgi:hypothetical protein
MARVVALSDDVVLSAAYPGPNPLIRLDFGTGMTVSSTINLPAPVSLQYSGGRTIVATRPNGRIVELDDNLKVLRVRAYTSSVTSLAVGSDGSLLLALSPCTSGASGSGEIWSGSLSSTTVHWLACAQTAISLTAAVGESWRAFAVDDFVTVLSGTVSAVPRLQVPSPDFTVLAISPHSVVAGPRTVAWSQLDQGSGTWNTIPRAGFAAPARAAQFTSHGAILASGDAGGFAIYSKGSWCVLDGSNGPNPHFHFDGVSIAPSGRVAFIAGNDSGGSGTVARISLPAGL